MAEAMAFIAWLVAGRFLVASLRYRLHAAGAFAAPVVLVLLLLARVVPAETHGGAAGLAAGHDAHLPGHAGRRHLRPGRGAGGRLPAAGAAAQAQAARSEARGESAPLDTLDRLAARCVSFGFPVFTLAIVTGAVWVARLGLLRTGQAVRPEYLLAVVAWAGAGRPAAGAGGGRLARAARRLADGGRVLGAALVLVGYFLRHTV